MRVCPHLRRALFVKHDTPVPDEVPVVRGQPLQAAQHQRLQATIRRMRRGVLQQLQDELARRRRVPAAEAHATIAVTQRSMQVKVWCAVYAHLRDEVLWTEVFVRRTR